MDIDAQTVNLYTQQIKDGKVKYTKASPLDAEGLGLGKLATRDGGILTDASKYEVAKAGNLDDDDYFIHKGRYYRIKNATYVVDRDGKRVLDKGSLDAVAGDVIQTPDRPWNSKSLGGRAVAGQTYTVNDRINALGIQQEVFRPDVSGTIYPNIATMPRYDVGSKTQLSGVNISNSPSSNNVYDINIALNGTNVTAQDVIIEMKREMALVNAKEGINRYVGGAII